MKASWTENRSTGCRIATGSPRLWLAGLVLVGVALSGCGAAPSSPANPGGTASPLPAPVEVVKARVGTVSRTVEVTGSLKARQEIPLGPKRDGRVAEVRVREGDRVSAGQVVARLEDTDARAQVGTAEAAVNSAQAQVAQAEATWRQQVVTTRAAIATATANLATARARLSQVRSGARRQEIGQAETAVAIARSNFDRAVADYHRYARLGKAGAAADVDVERYRANRDVCAEQLRAAEQALSLLKEGARVQEVEQARQAVRQAEEAVRQARAAAAQDDVRRAEITTARAALQQATNSLSIARQVLADTSITAPVSGRVSARAAEPGQVVAAGAPMLKMVSTGGVYFEPTVPETDYRWLKVGQGVGVRVDALPAAVFAGQVTRLSPAGQASGRSFAVRIDLVDPRGTLLPAMFARGRIEVERRAGCVLAPRDAVVGGRVFEVVADRAHSLAVDGGLASEDPAWMEVPRLSHDALIVVAGHRGLKEGERVQIRTTTAGPRSGDEAGGTLPGSPGVAAPVSPERH